MVGVGVDPGPELDAGAAFAGALPRALAPVVGVPAAEAESQVQLAGVGVLQDLAQRARDMAEVVLGKRRLALVAAEVEGREEGVLGQRAEEQLLVVVGGRSEDRGRAQQEAQRGRGQRGQHRSIAAAQRGRRGRAWCGAAAGAGTRPP